MASPLPSCPLDKPGRKAWGQDGGLSAPGTPSFAPWDVGVDHELERVPKAWKGFPPEGGEEVAACALTAWLILVKRGKQRGGFPTRLSIKGPSKRPRPDFRVPELCPVRRRGWGGSCPLATPRQGVQGQDEALHRFWRGLALVELWGPRPRVPPYPGPRDIKGERGGKVGYG